MLLVATGAGVAQRLDAGEHDQRVVRGEAQRQGAPPRRPAADVDEAAAAAPSPAST